MRFLRVKPTCNNEIPIKKRAMSSEEFPPLPFINSVDDWARQEELDDLISSPVLNFKQWATAFMILLDKVVPDESSYQQTSSTEEKKLQTMKVYCEGHHIQLDFKDGLMIHVSGYEQPAPASPEEKEDSSDEQDKKEDSSDDWTVPKTRKQVRKERQTVNEPVWYLFADDMRNPHMAFVEMVYSKQEALDKLEDRYMGHIYCPDTNVVYDKVLTPYESDESKVTDAFCSKFYLNKFSKWQSWSEKVDPESLQSEFIIYTQASSWDPDDVEKVDTVGTLNEAREVIKDCYSRIGLKWFHVHCPETNIVYDYKFSDHRFCQKMKVKHK